MYQLVNYQLSRADMYMRIKDKWSRLVDLKNTRDWRIERATGKMYKDLCYSCNKISHMFVFVLSCVSCLRGLDTDTWYNAYTFYALSVTNMHPSFNS